MHETYAVCFGSHSVCEAHNGSGEMGMGIGKNRGHQWDQVIDAMDGHVHGSKGKGPKIHTWVLSPLKIIFLLYCTVHLCLSNVTSQPTSVNTHIPNREAIDKSGIMCLIMTNGRPSMCMLHMSVDTTCRPSANVTLSGHVVRSLLITLASSMTKIWVTPKSAMAVAVFS